MLAHRFRHLWMTVEHALNECGRSYPQEMGFLCCWGCYVSVLGRAGLGSWWLMGTGRDKLPLCSASSGRAWNYSWKLGFGSPSSFLGEDEGKLERIRVHSLQGRCDVFPHLYRRNLQKALSVPGGRTAWYSPPRYTNHRTWLGLLSHSGIAFSSTVIWNTLRFLVSIWR